MKGEEGRKEGGEGRRGGRGGREVLLAIAKPGALKGILSAIIRLDT